MGHKISVIIIIALLLASMTGVMVLDQSIGAASAGTVIMGTTTGDFEYSSNGTAITITRYTGSNTTLVIPSMIDGLPVVAIGDYAFLDCPSLKSVTIPDSITYIGDGAFEECSALTSVTIGDGVTYIGSYAFSDCYALTSVTFTGDAPSSVARSWAYWCSYSLVVYYYEGATGFSSGTFGGVSCEMLAAPPTDLTATPGSSKVVLSWEESPSSNLTSYAVYVNGIQWTTVSNTTLTTTFSNLTNGADYLFIVGAVNVNGTSKSSGVSVTPMSVPGTPTGLSAYTNNTGAILGWIAPSDTGGSTMPDYTVYVNGVAWATTSSTTFTLSNLTQGRTYTFSVAASNSVGNGTASQSVTATTGGGSASIAWPVVAVIALLAAGILAGTLVFVGRKRTGKKNE